MLSNMNYYCVSTYFLNSNVLTFFCLIMLFSVGASQGSLPAGIGYASYNDGACQVPTQFMMDEVDKCIRTNMTASTYYTCSVANGIISVYRASCNTTDCSPGSCKITGGPAYGDACMSGGPRSSMKYLCNPASNAYPPFMVRRYVTYDLVENRNWICWINLSWKSSS